jgi:hypothetical protein
MAFVSGKHGQAHPDMALAGGVFDVDTPAFPR